MNLQVGFVELVLAKPHVGLMSLNAYTSRLLLGAAVKIFLFSALSVCARYRGQCIDKADEPMRPHGIALTSHGARKAQT